jgi:hypothetical protein
MEKEKCFTESSVCYTHTKMYHLKDFSLPVSAGNYIITINPKILFFIALELQLNM